jgi:hypothetical protein
MKYVLLALGVVAVLTFSRCVQAQQSQDFGQYVVHYNALNTNLIPPQVAKGYGIQRSSSRALLNVTVLRKVMNNPGSPVEAEVSASGINLTGQRREIAIREIREPEGAVYYIGELPIHNMETYNFAISLKIEGESEPLLVKFQQQFYTE